MSEPFLERLSRFTPDAGKLDRDAMLFAAGRGGAAHPNRGWITLTAALAGTQALSLALLWPHAAPPAGGLGVPIAASSKEEVGSEPSTADASMKPGVWSARHGLLESASDDHPVETITFIESGPPLRAFAAPPPAILN